MAERWEEIAHNMGTYSFRWGVSVDRGLWRVPSEDKPGDWTQAEPACKRIAALEAEKAELVELLDQCADMLEEADANLRQGIGEWFEGGGDTLHVLRCARDAVAKATTPKETA